MDKFLLCSNPMKPETPGEFTIVHTMFPMMVILCHKGHLDKKKSHYVHSFKDDSGQVQVWTMEVFNNEFDENIAKEKQVVDRSWRWFRSFLEEKRKESLLQFVKSNL